MLARRLRAWLCIQAAAAAGSAAWLAAPDGRFGNTLLLALAVLFAIHGGAFVIRLTVASRFAATLPDGRPVGRWRLLGGGLAAFGAFIALYFVLMPFERQWMGAEALSPRRRCGQPIIVLIHGYLCNRGLWWWLRRQLRRSGAAVATITLEPPFGDIEAFADQLNQLLLALTVESETPLVLVGHSMGGLVARAYLRRYGPGRVVKLITLGSPHHGTRSARIAPGTNARQMEPDSPWLATLNAAEPPPVPALSLWSTHDEVVLPPSSGHLRGAAELVLPALGHLAMAFSPRILAVLEREAASPPKGATGEPGSADSQRRDNAHPAA